MLNGERALAIVAEEACFMSDVENKGGTGNVSVFKDEPNTDLGAPSDGVGLKFSFSGLNVLRVAENKGSCWFETFPAEVGVKRLAIAASPTLEY